MPVPSESLIIPNTNENQCCGGAKGQNLWMKLRRKTTKNSISGHVSSSLETDNDAVLRWSDLCKKFVHQE